MSTTTYTNPPEVVVNLDLPPRQRWKHIAFHYRDKLGPLVEYLNDQRVKELGCCNPIATSFLGFINKRIYLLPELKDELEGFAEVTEEVGFGWENILSFNYGYDFLAYCTSTTTRLNSIDETPYHLRNMDWDKVIADCLCELTINVSFQRKSRTIYKATTWVGMIGLLTAMSPNFGISLNYRHTTEPLGMIRNVLSMLAGYWPIGLLIRHTMDQNLDYEDAVHVLSITKIMAPCYLVITGAKPCQGTLITRTRTGTLKPINLSKREYIVQTNIDHWVHSIDPVWAGDDELLQNALERRIANECNLKTYEQGENYLDFAFKIMSEFPTCNDQTVYQVVMHPAENLYITRVVYNPPSQYSNSRHIDLSHLNNDPYQPEYYSNKELESSPLRLR